MQRNGQVIEGGVVAGLVGGLALTLWMVIGRAAAGVDVWPALKGSAFPFLGERALAPGFDGLAVSLGVFTHYAVAIVWGLLFAVAFRGLSRVATLAAGLFWGLVVWVVMYYVVLPMVGAAELTRGPISMAVITHVLFGFFLALGYLPFQRPIAARREVRP